jgi:hypothetical protein
VVTKRTTLGEGLALVGKVQEIGGVWRLSAQYQAGSEVWNNRERMIVGGMNHVLSHAVLGKVYGNDIRSWTP